jgi:hypothetical protein
LVTGPAHISWPPVPGPVRPAAGQFALLAAAAWFAWARRGAET